MSKIKGKVTFLVLAVYALIRGQGEWQIIPDIIAFLALLAVIYRNVRNWNE